MCLPALLPIAGAALGGVSAAGAAGATALTIAQGIGAGLSIGGALGQGVAGYQTERAQAGLYMDQAKTDAQLTSLQDQRERDQFAAQIAQQRAELAARGITLDSVTAVQLGRKAAAEMSYQSQATEAQGTARQTELQNEAAMARARAVNSLLTGFTSAAASTVTMAPNLWPGLQGSGVKPNTTGLAGG